MKVLVKSRVLVVLMGGWIAVLGLSSCQNDPCSQLISRENAGVYLACQQGEANEGRNVFRDLVQEHGAEALVTRPSMKQVIELECSHACSNWQESGMDSPGLDGTSVVSPSAAEVRVEAGFFDLMLRDSSRYQRILNQADVIGACEQACVLRVHYEISQVKERLEEEQSKTRRAAIRSETIRIMPGSICFKQGATWKCRAESKM